MNIRRLSMPLPRPLNQPTGLPSWTSTRGHQRTVPFTHLSAPQKPSSKGPWTRQRPPTLWLIWRGTVANIREWVPWTFVRSSPSKTSRWKNAWKYPKNSEKGLLRSWTFLYFCTDMHQRENTEKPCRKYVPPFLPFRIEKNKCTVVSLIDNENLNNGC